MSEIAVTECMLDTVVFNRVVEGKIFIESNAPLRLLATRVQMAELRATRSTEKRENLLAVFAEIAPEVVLTSSFAFDIEGAGFDEAYWNDGSRNFERMLGRLRELDAKKGKGAGKDGLGQERDVLIAETAIKNHAILVTEDANLRQVFSEFGGRAIDCQQFAREMATR